MNAVKLAGLEPASVFGYFEEICSIPHGSGNTKMISDYLVSFAKEHGHKIWITRALNPFVWRGSFFLPPIPKMFSDSYYVQEMSKYDFDYQVISFEDSLKGLEARKTMR